VRERTRVRAATAQVVMIHFISLLLVLKYSFISQILSHPPFFVYSQTLPIVFLSSPLSLSVPSETFFFLTISHLVLLIPLLCFLF